MAKFQNSDNRPGRDSAACWRTQRMEAVWKSVAVSHTTGSVASRFDAKWAEYLQLHSHFTLHIHTSHTHTGQNLEAAKVPFSGDTVQRGMARAACWRSHSEEPYYKVPTAQHFERRKTTRKTEGQTVSEGMREGTWAELEPQVRCSVKSWQRLLLSSLKVLL